MRVTIKHNLFTRVRSFVFASVVAASSLAAFIPAIAAPVAGAESCSPQDTYTINANDFSWSNPTGGSYGQSTSWTGSEVNGPVTVTATGSGTTSSEYKEVTSTQTVTVTKHNGYWRYSDNGSWVYVDASKVYDINGNSGKYDAATQSWQWVNDLTPTAPSTPNSDWTASVPSTYRLSTTAEATYTTWWGISYTSSVDSASISNYGFFSNLSSVAYCATVNDTTPPVVTITPDSTTQQYLHGTETFTISVTDNQPLDPSKLTNIWVYLYDNGGMQKSQGANVDLSSGTGIFTVDTTKLDDGAATLDVAKLYDAAGNASGASDNYFGGFIVDNTSPVVTIDNAAPAATYKLNDPISVHVSDTNLAYTDIDRIDANAPANNKHWVYTGAWFGLWWLQDGTYTLTAHDAAGNTTAYTFTTDETKPVVTGSTEPTINPTSFTVTATDNISVAKVTANVYKDNGTGTYTLFQSHSSTTSNPYTVDLSTLSDGNYYVKYNAADEVGNISNTNSFYFTVDHTAPVVTANDVALTQGSTGVLNGTVDDATSTVTVMIDGTSYPVVQNGTTWTVALPNTLTVGKHTVAATATDAANNVSAVAGATITVNAKIVSQISQLTTPPTTPSNLNNGGQNGGTINTSGDQGVLGDATTTPNSDATDTTTTTPTNITSDEGVKGANTTKHSDAWIWWIILAALILAAIWWFIAAARRRSNEG